MAVSLMAACGTAPTTSPSGTATSTASTSTASKISIAPLAPKANKLCSAAPTNVNLNLRLDTPGNQTLNTSDVGLQALNESAPGADGPFTMASVANTTVVQPVAGTSSSGSPLTYEELYFSTNGAIPASVKNVEVCVEMYDAAAGQDISAEFSGNNPAGALSGAYDAAPEAYTTSGTKKWYTLSFNFSGISFQNGASGIGKENGSADFRINLASTTVPAYFKRIWIVTQNVSTNPSLAGPPAGVPLSGSSTTSSSTS